MEYFDHLQTVLGYLYHHHAAYPHLLHYLEIQNNKQEHKTLKVLEQYISNKSKISIMYPCGEIKVFDGKIPSIEAETISRKPVLYYYGF